MESFKKNLRKMNDLATSYYDIKQQIKKCKEKLNLFDDNTQCIGLEFDNIKGWGRKHITCESEVSDYLIVSYKNYLIEKIEACELALFKIENMIKNFKYEVE